jgi:hypothetical protein
VSALEAQDEIADPLEQRWLQLGFVGELRAYLAERRPQLRLQLGIVRVRARELLVQGFEGLVQPRTVRARGCPLEIPVRRGGLQRRRLRWL